MIELSGVQKSFGENRVLRGVDLTIQTGESMVIIGGSGTGKSVILKHIVGLLTPDAGSVRVDGQEISKLSGAALSDFRRRFGLLFQGAALFDSLSVAENVAFGLRARGGLSNIEIEMRVRQKLAMVGLADRAIENLMPADLSGGMKKRVGLARAIATDPTIILYDEPTTGLDPIMADVINRLISETNKKLSVTSVTITHDMKSAYQIADRIAVLYQGKILEVGTPEEIQRSASPIVQQFIHGRSEGPITTGVAV